MTEAVQVKGNQGLTFTQEQINLIKSQVAPDATIDELQLFLHVAKKAGLDPLSRQVYCIHRNVRQGAGFVKKMTIQTSIDGFRVIAERSGSYAGQSEPEFEYDANGHLRMARVRVYRFHPKSGERYEASVGVAFWDEYVQTDREGKPMGLWVKMKHNMLAKVAEALALRKAYPQDLSDIYTNEEMEQADSNVQTVEPVSEKTADELKAEYLELLTEYGRVADGVDIARFDPDNWKVEQNSKNFIYAIETLKGKIQEAKIKTDGKN